MLGAADKECDHWHDDAGVMTHHVAFTLEMEQSLQTIDASVTIPYWDYTQDAYVGWGGFQREGGRGGGGRGGGWRGLCNPVRWLIDQAAATAHQRYVVVVIVVISVNVVVVVVVVIVVGHP